MKVAGIYKITSPSGKIYIGQSWDMDVRWKEYKSKGAPNQPALKHSLLKYGAKNHHFALVWGFQYPTQDLLDGAETMYIRLNKQAGKEMLNIKEGGRGGLHSPETKKKMSLKRKGIPKSKSFCEAITKRQLGIPRCEGEKNNKAKLTLDQVLEIRKNFNGLFSYYSKMASLYGVDKASIGNIIRRKTWKHI